MKLFQTFDGDELIMCIKKLVSIDKEWVPRSDKASLYIRPTLIGTEVYSFLSISKFKKNLSTYSIIDWSLLGSSIFAVVLYIGYINH